MKVPANMDAFFSGEHGTASMVGFVVAVIATALLSNYWAVQSVPVKGSATDTDTAKTTTTTTTKKKTRGAVCPFSAESNFLVETADHMPPSPLDLARSWIDQTHPDFGKPLAARWLNAGISGQDTPGMLRAGLKRLRNAEFFLVEESYRMREELLMKSKALDDPVRFPTNYVQEDDSVAAQLEVVDLFLHYLPKRYPDLYTYNKEAHTLYVKALDKTFVVDEWKERPLEFCERIVQEDLVLMRPSRPTDAFDSFAMAAAGVVFSFSGLQEKLSQPIEFIHAPVPGYEKHLRKTLNLTFGKLLKVDQPMWRNNWGITVSGELDNPLYGTAVAHAERKFSNVSREQIKAMFLKVEYQTIRRLPTSGYLLFTVKTMADRMDSLEEVPAAAKSLATSIRGMSAAMQLYKGIEDEATSQAVLAYLDDISGDAK
jgi:hypothetical protein